MIIVSPFRDYYDNLRSLSFDKSIVYNRVGHQIFPGEYQKHPISSALSADRYSRSLDHSNPMKHLSRYSRHVFGKTELVPLAVLFCGKVYFGFRHNVPFTSEYTYYWDSKSFQAYLDEYIPNPSKPDRYRTSHKDYLELLSLSGSSVYESLMIEHKLVNVVYQQKFTLEGRLADVGFQKLMGAQEAYQEIEQWLGGVLTNNTPIPEVPDKYKIQQHGFDKNSFRKPSSK